MKIRQLVRKYKLQIITVLQLIIHAVWLSTLSGKTSRSLFSLAYSVNRTDGLCVVGNWLVMQTCRSDVALFIVIDRRCHYFQITFNIRLIVRCLWPPYVIGADIIFLPCDFYLLLSFFFLFFPRLISAVGDWMSTILPHKWCGLSANLECMFEMCRTWLAGNAGLKKSPKMRHLGTIAQLCRTISSQLRHISTIGKKLVKQQYLLHMSS